MALKEIGRERASFAYERVSKVSQNQKEFKAHVKSLPMLIKTNGLAAAFSFAIGKSKKYSHYEHIVSISREWLNKQQLIVAADNEDFMKKLLNLDAFTYRRSISELMALFTWLKRFAEGLNTD